MKLQIPYAFSEFSKIRKSSPARIKMAPVSQAVLTVFLLRPSQWLAAFQAEWLLYELHRGTTDITDPFFLS